MALVGQDGILRAVDNRAREADYQSAAGCQPAPQEPVGSRMRIHTFDTTLRDGTQGEFVSFSVEDKLLIAQKLDELGIDYIEGGWPGSNPKDKDFFARAAEVKFRHAKLTAFGATRLAKNPVEQDKSVRALAEAGTPAVAVFGKTWDLHVKRALGISLDENLALISETVRFLKRHGKEVIYDAEHFFDGYRGDPDYALRTLEAALAAGADVLCLCDTNGGTLTGRIAEVVGVVHRRFGGVIGIHAHNDSDMAVANSRGRGGSGRRACARLSERLWRALRQREPGVRHRQSRIEGGLRNYRFREARRACGRMPVRRRAG